jgi:AcrR family transcriptional regulator
MDFTPILTPAVPADARTRILDAAETLVRARGVAGLTLEAAAKLAGISKGGLLYHFASKEALLTGLLARMAEFIAADFDAGVAAQPPGPGRVARAMLTWGFGLTPDAMNERCDRAAAVFLAAFHHDPALLDPVRAVVARMRAAVLADGLPPGHGGAIMAAGDGLFMARIFGMYAPAPEELRQMHAALSRLLPEAAQPLLPEAAPRSVLPEAMP